ncbi:AraC family transcriptional regulator [Amphritea japonica]|uniref:AraC family transcriptional regulator n=1 Tax=Amphritea japonica ATCC BAA-1530 TaxID=1278309 RepID=A0A7R6P9P9_9GAMM|nr:AraC family transcriptional regulator [Amphritea japonica]BBB25987.1 AraC family transcriptional regulator [Amphritea japonica ATCC BAA-1530]
MSKAKPIFWRDARMPYVELRLVSDGREVCYAPHSHAQWSIGAITGGISTFCYRDDRCQVGAGDLVLLNPDWVHACNPIDDQPWSYYMLYIDTEWLAVLRYQLGVLDEPVWEDIGTAIISEHQFYLGYCQMASCLLSSQIDLKEKQAAVIDFISSLMEALAGRCIQPAQQIPSVLLNLAAYLDENAAEEVLLEDMCLRSGYSAGHLIRTFKQHFNLTPHAYQINRRIQRGQRELKRGRPIADVALAEGFTDQPHFQRVFKKLVAATPNQYRQSLLSNEVKAADHK